MITYACGHQEDLGLGDFDFTSAEYVCRECAKKNGIMVSCFGDVPEEMLKTMRIECINREMRQAKSLWHCSIPDWSGGSGGMVQFWINDDDGTYYESMDSRLTDADIRDGIRHFAMMDWR